jgi:NADH-quinone oxidoreductase subunit C
MSVISNEQVLNRLQEFFAADIISSDEPFGLLTVEITPAKAYEMVEWLKNDSVLQCSFLTNIAAVHYPNDSNREIAVVYQLHSWRNNFRLRLKAFLPISNPSIASLVPIYNGANWMERETFDFYGVNFEGHPNLKRILNEDSMDYFPMRKEFHLEDETREDKDDRFFGRF